MRQRDLRKGKGMERSERVSATVQILFIHVVSFFPGIEIARVPPHLYFVNRVCTATSVIAHMPGLYR